MRHWTGNARPLFVVVQISVHWRAGARQVPVAPDVVDPVNGWPIFVDPERARRETPCFTRVGPVPVFHEILHRVRCVFQRIVVGINGAIFNVGDLSPDGEHGIAKTVKFGLAFGFCRLDHQCTCHWPAHCWGVKPTINQSFGDVVHSDVGAFGEGARVDDAFVRNPASGSFVKDVKCPFEPLCDVVGI